MLRVCRLYAGLQGAGRCASSEVFCSSNNITGPEREREREGVRGRKRGAAFLRACRLNTARRAGTLIFLSTNKKPESRETAGRRGRGSSLNGQGLEGLAETTAAAATTEGREAEGGGEGGEQRVEFA